MAKTTKTKTTTATNAAPIDQRPTCSQCGGHDVETTAWVTTREDGTLAIVDGEGPFGDEMGNWCHDCQEHLDLDYQQTTPADNERRRKAEAAREAGPELLAALKALVRIGSISAGPVGNSRAMIAAKDLLDRLA